MVRYLSFLFAFSFSLISTAEAQFPPCDDTVFAEVYSDTVIVYHSNAEHNCCPAIVYTLGQQDSIIDLVETDTLKGCDCMCCIDISVTITDLLPGRYLIRVWNWDRSLLHGEVWVTIGKGAGTGPYLGEVIQSDCSSTRIEEDRKLPNSLKVLLVQSFPNPFRTQTTIRYQLYHPDFVTLEVYNCYGNLLRTLVNRKQSEGSYFVSWDGKDASGKHLPTGTYFYRLKAGSHGITKKIIVMR